MTGRIVVEYFFDRHVAVVRLDNPARKNAISLQMWRDLEEFASRVGADDRVRVIVITGHRDVFSSGADITDFDAARSEQTSRSYDDLVEQTCRRVEAIPQATICAIEGYCVGAGASLACSCDLRIASETAAFVVPAAKLGLGYDMRGIHRFRRIFGHSVTSAILLTAAKMPSSTAFALGAVYALHPPREVEDAALRLAESIAGNAPLTLRAAKLSLRALSTNDDDLGAQALELSARADASDDYREGRAAFREGRRPVFGGR